MYIFAIFFDVSAAHEDMTVHAIVGYVSVQQP